MTLSFEDNIGTTLYKIVKEYSDLGIHRTGTDVDKATADWFAEQLKKRGAKVSRQEYSFDFFDGASKVILDGIEIPSMPLYYEAIGDFKTNHVAVAEFGDGEHGSGLDNTLESMIDSAMLAGYEALVIATHGGKGNLVAINCEPKLRNRIPVILVPGRYANALKTNSISIEYTAVIKPGASTNITGHWGESSADPPLVITTPMSGWFTCAGERGTGIAVSLHVAEWLSKQMPHFPLQLIALSGHELGFCGAYRLTETVTVPPKAVMHLGSCLAAIDAQMQSILHADTSTSNTIQNALAPMQVTSISPENPLNPDCWVGESQCWAKFGVPMLSVAGLSPLFHTPDDVAEKATTAELLNTVARCFTKAAVAMSQISINK